MIVFISCLRVVIFFVGIRKILCCKFIIKFKSFFYCEGIYWFFFLLVMKLFKIMFLRIIVDIFIVLFRI